MANSDNPSGFRLVGSLGSGVQNHGQSEYAVASDNSNNIFMGDPVKMLSSGKIDVATASSDKVLGIFNGCFFTDAVSGKPTYSKLKSSSNVADDIVASVIDDKSALYEVQSSSALGQTNVGNTVVIAYTSGDTSIGISKAEVDSAGTSSLGQFKVVRFSQDPENEKGAVNTKVIVSLNQSFYNDGSAGV